jgi:hypothetical protein
MIRLSRQCTKPWEMLGAPKVSAHTGMHGVTKALAGPAYSGESFVPSSVWSSKARR